MRKKIKKKEGIEKEEKIIREIEFTKIFRLGKREKNNLFSIYYKKNNCKKSRISIVTGKKLGNAVLRNRTKRIIREIYRKNKYFFENNFDWILIPYGNWKNMNYWFIEGLLICAIKKCKTKIINNGLYTKII